MDGKNLYERELEHEHERVLDELVLDFLDKLGKIEARRRLDSVLSLASRLVEFAAFEAARNSVAINVPDLILTSANLDKVRELIDFTSAASPQPELAKASST